MKTRALWIVLVLCGIWLCFGSVGAQEVSISRIAYSKDGRYLAVLSWELSSEHLTIYEIQGNRLGTVVLDIPYSDSFPLFEWNPVYTSLIMLVSPELISVYDVDAHQYVQRLHTGWGYHREVIWTSDGEHIIANGSSDMACCGTTLLFDGSAEGIEVDDPKYSSYPSDVIALAIDPASTKLITSRNQWNEAYIRDLTQPDHPLIHRFEWSDEHVVTDFVWTSEILVLQKNAAGGSYLYFYAPNSYDQPIDVYSLSTYYSDGSFALRPHTTQVAVGEINGIFLYDWITQSVTTEIEASNVRSLDWSADGRYLVYVSDGELYIEEMPFGGSPSPTITPIVINGLTPVVLPTRSATQTPTLAP